jgi:hypothetical protein
MTEFEFFMELRINSVEQLGQVRLAILETNGQISVYFYEDDEVKAGLSILPSRFTAFYHDSADDEYACVRCSIVMATQPGINNYVLAAQMQNGRRPAGRKGHLTAIMSVL